VVQQLNAAKDEYLTFLKNGKAPDKDEIERSEKALSPDNNPADLKNTLIQMAHTIAARGGQLQRNYTTTMGKKYDGMLDPDNDKILKGWGINTDKMNGINQQPNVPASQTAGIKNSAADINKLPAQPPPNTVHMQIKNPATGQIEYRYIPKDQVPVMQKRGATVVGQQ